MIVITKIDAKILSSTQLPNVTLSEYTEALWNNALLSNLVFDEYVMIRMVTDALHGLIRRSICLDRNQMEDLQFTT